MQVFQLYPKHLQLRFDSILGFKYRGQTGQAMNHMLYSSGTSGLGRAVDVAEDLVDAILSFLSIYVGTYNVIFFFFLLCIFLKPSHLSD